MNSSLVLGKPVYMAVTMQEPCDNQNGTQSSFIVRGVKNAASTCLSTFAALKNAVAGAGQWVNENRATAALLLGVTVVGAGVATGLAMFSEESQATCIATSELISINNGFDISGSGSGSGDFSFDVDSEN